MRSNHGRTVALALCALALLILPGPVRGDVIPSTRWVNFYGEESTLNDAPLPAGAVVRVYDSSGVQCGEYTLTQAGWYGLMPCYGDDAFTPEDEGAVYDEVVQFVVNGAAGVAVPCVQNNGAVTADTIVKWSGNQDVWRVELHAPAPVGPTANIEVMDADVVLNWPPSPFGAATFEVWRSTDPYFLVGARGSSEVADVPAAGSKVTWHDAGQAADVASNYFYHVRALDVAGAPLALPGAVVGEFGFALIGDGGIQSR